MRTHILFLLIAFAVSACASHQGERVSEAQKAQQEQDHYSMVDGSASRIR